MSWERKFLQLISPFITVYICLCTMFYSGYAILLTYIGTRDDVDKMVARWSRHLLRVAGATVKVTGLENIPDGGVLYVFNHTSFFDIPVTHGYIPKSFRYGAKIELFSVPMFGPAIRRAQALPITRHDRAGVMKIYEEAVRRFHAGESFFLAPEGTRQKEPVIGPFKSGPFIFAINAQVPVVPVVLTGVHRLMEKGALTINYKIPHRLTMDILPAVPTQGLTLQDREELKDRVRAMMVEKFELRSSESESSNSLSKEPS